MKPMNRMEAFLIGDKTLTPETRQEAVAKYVGEKLNSGGTKEQILLFENVQYTKDASSKSLSSLGVSEIINNLPGITGSSNLLKEYRLIVYAKYNDFLSKAIIEYPFEHNQQTTTCYRVPLCTNQDLNLAWFEFKEIFGEMNVLNMAGYDTCDVTCYLEKL